MRRDGHRGARRRTGRCSTVDELTTCARWGGGPVLRSARPPPPRAPCLTRPARGVAVGYRGAGRRVVASGRGARAVGIPDARPARARSRLAPRLRCRSTLGPALHARVSAHSGQRESQPAQEVGRRDARSFVIGLQVEPAHQSSLRTGTHSGNAMAGQDAPREQ